MYQPFKRISQGTYYWQAVRDFCGITASQIPDLFSMGYGSPPALYRSKIGILEDKKPILPSASQKSKALQHGRKYEPIARTKLESLLGEKINLYGIFMHEKYGLSIAGSPDGYIKSSGTLVEIKCPYFVPKISELELQPERVPYNDIKLGHLIQMIVLMELLNCVDGIYFCYAVPLDSNLDNSKYKAFRIKRQTGIWGTYILPEILRFLDHVKKYNETPNPYPLYRGAPKEVKEKLLKELLAIEKNEINF